MKMPIMSILSLSILFVSFSEGMQPAPAVRVAGPETYISIANATTNDYALYSTDFGTKIADIPKAGRVNKIRLTDWENNPAGKFMRYNVQDNSGNRLLKLQISNPRGMTIIQLRGAVSDDIAQSFKSGVPAGIDINLTLKGDNLELSRIDATTVEKD